MITPINPVTTPTTVYLNQLGVYLYDPQRIDGGVTQLPYPITLKFYIDDVYVK